ncbi:MAG TPA: helix-turn-helix transcriptional regulator, partial [Erysipelothrix sp.]|nr:helix-turn-helix transcriptional regulator [Erysipelothrix sp.]
SLTQADLAEMVGVSRQTIISLEKGSYNPSLELAFKISKVLKASIDDLFRMEEDDETI